jgi:hypothetical protein
MSRPTPTMDASRCAATASATVSSGCGPTGAIRTRRLCRVLPPWGRSRRRYPRRLDRHAATLLSVLGMARCAAVRRRRAGSLAHREQPHWVLDVGFDEDRARNRCDHGPANLATLRKLALNVLRTARTDISIRR